ncbi:ATP phosphoribosyltransferase [Helicobacter saguini]|uniref:ATP phosphoribosyltransferase n=1 Tax=Helicobacter saguini TaxID=1548018 RepID=A0A347VST0_9HELI|nr:ATP phosphoribosyltransferase [Helicobacter saguini]MWV62377.1 ATP phosphoribosyltransferase [Helicobacter saguini]MWV66951.1 ATP phosphoribosyltransferase [Helicobacter saguini]MWV69299.1 ATP phosphoribosyltransferase [Helicobacter saguini]MWV71145.1 ATP phosphoribosyltransferase [Helicobacter saguini]TLD94964.1 ATP phosphoribosyltransferase [Helicobacter saguini]
MLTIALPKGRIAQDSLVLFSKIFNQSINFDDRRLILRLENITFLNVRNQDVPTYVHYGAADLGIVGLDVLEERSDIDVVRLLNLNIGKCKVVVGSECGKPINYLKPRIKIATKMTNITQNFFSARAIAVDVIKLYGSIELAPLVNLADGIVDIVETGSTMKQNNLQIDEVIMHSSAFLIANQNSFYVKKDSILSLQEELKKLI